MITSLVFITFITLIQRGLGELVIKYFQANLEFFKATSARDEGMSLEDSRRFAFTYSRTSM